MILPPDIHVENLAVLRDALLEGDFSKYRNVATIRLKGGKGSGHFGHKGRPGLEGGSLPREVSQSYVHDEIIQAGRYSKDLRVVLDKGFSEVVTTAYEIGQYWITDNGTILRVEDHDTYANQIGWENGRQELSYEDLISKYDWIRMHVSHKEMDFEVKILNTQYLKRLHKLLDAGIISTARVDNVVIASTDTGEFLGGSALEFELSKFIHTDEDGIISFKQYDVTVEKQLPIKDKDRQKFLQLRVNIFYDTTDKLSEQVFSGEITIGEWEEKMRSELRQLHSSAAAIAKGGWDEMDSADWGRLGTPLREQYKYLHGFATTIDEQRDTISLKAIQARARMYGRATKTTAALMQAGAVIENLLPWMPGDGSTRCLVNCKCAWVLRVIKVDKNSGDKTVNAVWRLTPAEHCEDCLDRNGHVETFVVPKDVKVPKYVGRLS